MASCAWLLQTAEKAIAEHPAGYVPRGGKPCMNEPSLTPEEGTAEQFQAILLVEALGMPEPDMEPIRHRDLRM